LQHFQGAILNPFLTKGELKATLIATLSGGNSAPLFDKRGIKDKNLAVANLAGGLNLFSTKGELKLTRNYECFRFFPKLQTI